MCSRRGQGQTEPSADGISGGQVPTQRLGSRGLGLKVAWADYGLNPSLKA